MIYTTFECSSCDRNFSLSCFKVFDAMITSFTLTEIIHKFFVGVHLYIYIDSIITTQIYNVFPLISSPEIIIFRWLKKNSYRADSFRLLILLTHLAQCRGFRRFRCQWFPRLDQNRLRPGKYNFAWWGRGASPVETLKLVGRGGQRGVKVPTRG